MSHCACFSKFVSWANNSNTYRSSEFSRRGKCYLQNSWSPAPCKPCDFLAREALDAQTQNRLDIKSAKKWRNIISQKKVSQLNKLISCPLWMNLEVLPHNFLQPQKLSLCSRASGAASAACAHGPAKTTIIWRCAAPAAAASYFAKSR